jgi:hypothetical protein
MVQEVIICELIQKRQQKKGKGAKIKVASSLTFYLLVNASLANDRKCAQILSELDVSTFLLVKQLE